MERKKERIDAEREAAILDYLGGEMDDAERAAFERRLAADAELGEAVERARRAVGAAREWLDARAPGAERAAALPIPAPVVAVRRRAATRLWQAAAAAALFAGGFALGARSDGSDRSDLSDRSDVIAAPDPPAPPSVPAASPPRVYGTDERGRITIETSMADSRSRATWVVDADFSIHSPEGDGR